MLVKETKHQIGPCGRCKKRDYCEAHSALQRINKAWDADDVQVQYTYVSVTWADANADGSLNIRLDCSEYDEDLDA